MLAGSLCKEGKIKLSIKFIGGWWSSSHHVHDAAGHHNHLSNGFAIELGQGAGVVSHDFFHVSWSEGGCEWQLESHLAVE